MVRQSAVGDAVGILGDDAWGENIIFVFGDKSTFVFGDNNTNNTSSNGAVTDSSTTGSSPIPGLTDSTPQSPQSFQQFREEGKAAEGMYR